MNLANLNKLLSFPCQVRKFEESEQLLKCQLEEVCDQNEEMELRILELEDCTEKVSFNTIQKIVYTKKILHRNWNCI